MDSCYNCKYLKENETWDGKTYCENKKVYIKPYSDGCKDHEEKD